MTDLSVVMPAHDVGPWLGECLSSILDDQDVDLELIVVDDGSTDETREVLATRAGDPRLRVVENPGHGGAQARNYGVRLAMGTYLAFCDGDDLVPPGAYARMLAAAKAQGADMVIGSFVKFFPNRIWHPTASWPAFDEPRHGVTLRDQPSLIANRACWNRLFDRETWLAWGIDFPSVPRSNDIVPMTRALVAARRIEVLAEPVYLYRGRPGGGSMTSRAREAAGVVSYLGQEEESLALTAALDDEELTLRHQRLFILQDGWIHVRNLLREAPVQGAGAELAAVRERLARMYVALRPDVRAQVRGERALVYRLLLDADDAGAALAAAVAVARSTEPKELAKVPGVLDALAGVSRLPEPPAQQVREMLTDEVLVPLGLRFHPAPELAGDLRRHRELLASAEVAALPLGTQQLLAALRGSAGEDERLDEVLAAPPARVLVRRVAERDGRLCVRVLVQGPVPSGVELRLGATALEQPAAGASSRADLIEGLLPPGLPEGAYPLRVRVGGFDAPVTLSRVAPGAAVVAGRDVTLSAAVDGGGVVVTVGPAPARPGVWARAVRRLRG